MLLTDGSPDMLDDPNVLFEVKFDGFRTVVTKRSGRVRIYTRHQREITPQFPEVADGLNAALAGDAVLDGELICAAPCGRPDFYALNARHLLMDGRKIALASSSSPSTFIAFDAIEAGHRSLAALPLTQRKDVLANIVQSNSAVQVMETFPGGSGRALFAAAADRDLEGVVGKRLDSRYRLDSRSSDWFKVKAWKRRPVALLGVRFEPEFTVLVGNAPGQVLCGVSLGWPPADRRALIGVLPQVRTHHKDGVTWLKPYLQGQIRYRVSPTGQVREPVWDGFGLFPAAAS